MGVRVKVGCELGGEQGLTAGNLMLSAIPKATETTKANLRG